MPIRCVFWQLESLVKSKVAWDAKQSPGPRKKGLGSGHGSVILSRRSTIFVPAKTQLFTRPFHSNAEVKSKHMQKEGQYFDSRGSLNGIRSAPRGLPEASVWFKSNMTLSPLVRQLFTEAGPEDSQPRITQSFRRTASGGNVATTSVANPSKMNIVNSSILDSLVETCGKLSKDDSLRAVVLTGGANADGKSPSFIGGADIKEMNALSSSQDAKAFITRVHAACRALRDLPVPVIARVHGFSLGAGLEIMAACDLRIVTKISTFGMPEVKVGIPSVVEAALLPGLIGMGRTRRLLHLAENIPAKEALEWGLVEKVVEDESALDIAVHDWTEAIAGMGPKSIRIQKVLMQVWENSTVEEGVQAGVEAFAEAYRDGGKEPKEFMAGSANRRR